MKDKSDEKQSNLIPVPRRKINYTKQDPLSRKLREFDNLKINTPLPTQAGIYINTNENGVPQTSRSLGMFPLIAQPFHIGFSGWHNFDIIAKRRSGRALICDLNPENALFLSYVLKLLTRCKTRFQFIEDVTAYMRKYSYDGLRTNENRDTALDKVNAKSLKFCLNVSELFPYTSDENHFSVFDEVKLELKRETSWLYSDDGYAHLRHLALQDKIVLITESICETDTFSAICRILRDNMMQIDTVYISNIADWMYNESNRTSFLETLKLFLSNKETLVIDAKKKGDEDNNLATQRCVSTNQLLAFGITKWFFPKFNVAEDKKAPASTHLKIV